MKNLFLLGVLVILICGWLYSRIKKHILKEEAQTRYHILRKYVELPGIDEVKP